MPRWVLPTAGACFLVLCGAMLLRSEPEVHTTSSVTRMIRQIALSANDPSAGSAAGLIGPWRVSASEVDPITGRLHGFQLTSGEMILGAKTARIIVDPVEDTFSFELWDVVFTRVPTRAETEVGHEGRLSRMDHHLLGPAPFGADIVPDGGVDPTAPPAPDDSPLERARRALDDA